MSVNQLKYYVGVIYGLCQNKNKKFNLHRALLISMLYHHHSEHQDDILGTLRWEGDRWTVKRMSLFVS